MRVGSAGGEPRHIGVIQRRAVKEQEGFYWQERYAHAHARVQVHASNLAGYGAARFPVFT